MSNALTPRRHLLMLGLGAGLAWAAPRAHACEYFTRTMRIIHPWTRATPADAPFATVNMRFDDVAQADRLIAVETPLAERAVMAGHAAHGAIAKADPSVHAPVDFAIAPGRESALSESGVHVRLLGLKQSLDVGRTYPMTLTFEQGGVVQVNLSVDFTRFQ